MLKVNVLNGAYKRNNSVKCVLTLTFMAKTSTQSGTQDKTAWFVLKERLERNDGVHPSVVVCALDLREWYSQRLRLQDTGGVLSRVKLRLLQVALHIDRHDCGVASGWSPSVRGQNTDLQESNICKTFFKCQILLQTILVLFYTQLILRLPWPGVFLFSRRGTP